MTVESKSLSHFVKTGTRLSRDDFYFSVRDAGVFHRNCSHG